MPFWFKQENDAIESFPGFYCFKMLKNPPRFGERQIFYLKLETAAVECVSQFDCFAAERSLQKEDLSREHTFFAARLGNCTNRSF